MADEDDDMHVDGYEDFSDGSGEHSTCAPSHALMCALGSASWNMSMTCPCAAEKADWIGTACTVPIHCLAYFLSRCLHLAAVCTASACWPGDPSCHQLNTEEPLD